MATPGVPRAGSAGLGRAESPRAAGGRRPPRGDPVRAEFHDFAGRPVLILGEGEPIRELIGSRANRRSDRKFAYDRERDEQAPGLVEEGDELDMEVDVACALV